jgi:DNA polymerase IV
MSGWDSNSSGKKPDRQLGLFEPVNGRQADKKARRQGAAAGAVGTRPVVSADRSPQFESRRIEKPTFPHRLIMLLDMDAFFASAEQVTRPELKGKPVIVGGLTTDRSVVASASYEARALGIKTAMPTAQAYRICPQGVFLRGNYHLYSSLSKKVMEICHTFTPIVQQASIDEAYMDLAGTQRLYGRHADAETRGRGDPALAGTLPVAPELWTCSSKNRSASAYLRVLSPDVEPLNWPVDLAERLLGTIRRETGLGATIGIGSNKLVARMAMERAKPGGVCYIWPGHEATFLATCPLADVPGIGRQTAAMLADYNLRTAADVQKMDRELLVVTFGERFGQILHDCAWGRGESHLELEYEQKSISRDTSFERDTTDMDYIRSILYYLTERACRTLRQMGQAAWTVSVKLRYSDFQTVGKSQTLEEPGNQDDAIYKVARDLLEKLYTRAISVRLVGVHLSGFVCADQVQLRIWEQQQIRLSRLCQASDLIRDRYGFCALMKGPAIELMGKMEHDAAGLKLRTSCLTK